MPAWLLFLATVFSAALAMHMNFHCLARWAVEMVPPPD